MNKKISYLVLFFISFSLYKFNTITQWRGRTLGWDISCMYLNFRLGETRNIHEEYILLGSVQNVHWNDARNPSGLMLIRSTRRRKNELLHGFRKIEEVVHCSSQVHVQNISTNSAHLLTTMQTLILYSPEKYTHQLKEHT